MKILVKLFDIAETVKTRSGFWSDELLTRAALPDVRLHHLLTSITPAVEFGLPDGLANCLIYGRIVKIRTNK
jgi:hypothetical protein